MSDGKKFNIWVAYSDLFSNLAIFLFISAFGVLAALGSSNSDPDPHPYVEGLCQTMNADVDTMLKAKGIGGEKSEFIQAQFIDHKGGRCRYLYRISNYHFLDDGRSKRSFVSTGEHGVPMSDVSLSNQVCEQVWGAATRQSLRDGNGHIYIVARIGSWPAPTCPIGKSTKAKAEQVALDCWLQMTANQRDNKSLQAAFNALPAACAAFRYNNVDCYGHSNPRLTSNCIGRDAAFHRAYFRRATCLLPIATARAESIFSSCRKNYLDNPDFDKQPSLSDGGQVPPSNEDHTDVMGSIWSDYVGYRGELANEPADESGVTNNAVFVEVQFDMRPN